VAKEHRPPGTQRPRLYRPRLHWELLVCGIRGHELIGTDAVRLRPGDELVAREQDGLRWYRCVRCDSWLPLPLPDKPKRDLPPAREEIELPLRGKALRDKIVLRIIAVDRAVHFVVLAALSVAAVLFASHELKLRNFFYRIVNAVQGSAAGPHQAVHAGFLHGIARVFNLSSTALYAVAAAAGAYAILEGAEAVGLWYQRRWAEYLTFVATLVFLPYEIYELVNKITVIRVGALVINLAVAAYLLWAKRLFGLRGGGEAEERARAYDVGWDALERTAPRPR
jgi:uncharacterized membrane protein (DUF2068 family)